MWNAWFPFMICLFIGNYFSFMWFYNGPYKLFYPPVQILNNFIIYMKFTCKMFMSQIIYMWNVFTRSFWYEVRNLFDEVKYEVQKGLQWWRTTTGIQTCGSIILIVVNKMVAGPVDLAMNSGYSTKPCGCLQNSLGQISFKIQDLGFLEK